MIDLQLTPGTDPRKLAESIRDARFGENAPHVRVVQHEGHHRPNSFDLGGTNDYWLWVGADVGLPEGQCRFGTRYRTVVEERGWVQPAIDAGLCTIVETA